MLPRTLSASSVKTFQGCPRRYVAENIQRGPNFQGGAANLGIVLHGALEDFIRGVKIKRNMQFEIDVLLALYREHYMKVIEADCNTANYRDGEQILINWMNRPYIMDDIFGVEVLSLEAKNNFEVPVLVGGIVQKIPFTYIMDRFDRIGPDEYKVVDYKSGRITLTADDLKDNIQAKVYALVAQITHKDAKRIWVEFDYLRQEKVSAVFTKADNAATWYTLKQIAQDIVDTKESDAKEVLNPECMFCVRKATCETLIKNQDVGGIMSLTLDEMAMKYHDVMAAVKALGFLKEDLEKQLLLFAAEEDLTEWETPEARVKVTTYSRRYVDPDKLALIVGSDTVAEMGGAGIAAVDELIKSGRLTATQIAAIKSITYRKTGSPSVKVAKKK